MLSSHAPRPLHIAGTGWCPTNAGDPTPSIAPGHARLAVAVAGSHSLASLKKLARASGAHVSPASCSPAAFAPWHVPLLRHHPHPGRFAHVAHDTAEWHSSRHSPTVSSDASFAKSGHPSSAASRERHRRDAGHHPHCASPPHDPHEPCAAQWSPHVIPHTRKPISAFSFGTSVQTTPPVSLR